MTFKIKPFLLIFIPLGLVYLTMTVPRGGTVSAESPSSTPTVNVQLSPTLPPAPVQADYGAQAFWLYCLPCHGDKGQGLTDEFRLVYPTEDQNCWLSGCHGKRPYPDGWTLPTTVPRLIGPGALSNFSDASAVHDFIHVAMPFQAPGHLDDNTYWALTAFLMRENGYWSGNGTLDESNAASVKIPGNHQAASTPVPIPVENNSPSFPILSLMSGIILIVLFALIIIFAIKRSREHIERRDNQ